MRESQIRFIRAARFSDATSQRRPVLGVDVSTQNHRRPSWRLGIVFQSPWLFLALSARAGGARRPDPQSIRRDLQPRRRRPAQAPAARRRAGASTFRAGMAGTFALAIGVALSLAPSVTAWVFEGLFAVALVQVIFGDVCGAANLLPSPPPKADGEPVTTLDARKPVEAEVRVGSARAPAKAGHRVDNLNRFQEFEVLVSALSFDAETERRAVAARKVATIESVGKDRLRMLDLEQIVSLVPSVEGVDDDVARRRRDAARRVEHPLKRSARPLADRRPALFAHVGGDLRAGRQASDLVERQLERTRDEAADREAPVRESFRRVALILRVSRVGLVPGRERIGDVGSAVSRASCWRESSSRLVLIVNTSAAPISPPRTRGGTNVSREHPVNNRPPSAGTLVSHVRREMRLIIASSFL